MIQTDAHTRNGLILEASTLCDRRKLEILALVADSLGCGVADIESRIDSVERYRQAHRRMSINLPALRERLRR